METVKQNIGVQGLLRKETVSQVEPFKLNIVLYTGTASQEWGGLADTKNIWENKPAHDPYNPHNPHQPWSAGSFKNKSEKFMDQKLQEIIHLREDGFIHVVPTDAVFYADNNSLEIIKNFLDTPVSEIAEKHSEILEALVLK